VIHELAEDQRMVVVHGGNGFNAQSVLVMISAVV